MDRQVVEEGAMWNDVDARGIDPELRDEPRSNRGRVADDAVDEAVEGAEQGVVPVGCVMWQQIMDGENDLCATPSGKSE